jgi:outer membrane protein assembly factor BamB
MNPKIAGLVTLLVLAGAVFAYISFQPPGAVSTSTTTSTTPTITTSTHSTPATTSTSQTTTTTLVSSTPTATSTTRTVQSLNWLTYHADNSRSGNAPPLNFTSISLKWKSLQLDGLIYAEPLVLGNSVLVATENDSVYSLNASTGSVNWRLNLGSPVPRSALPCGDIDPTGITGTPVIDPNARLIYALAFLNPQHHVLFAIGVDDGRIRFQQQADPQGMNPTVQQQRAALSLANGYVYIPYGGLFGDCGSYHGLVLGIKADGSGGTVSYQVPTSREGGIWAPSGAAIDSSGNLYVATGNGASSSAFDHGNSVIELSPSLNELGFFAPSNWAQLNTADTDLGSVGPTFVGNHTLFQIGKEGVGYLLNVSALGGIGGQLFSMNVCGGAYGGLAYSQPYVFVPCTNGLVAVKVTGQSFQVAWRNTGFFAGPPIVTGSAVWTVDRSGTLHVYALDGRSLFSYNVGNAVHFTTPSSGAGEAVVAAGNQLIAFGLS